MTKYEFMTAGMKLLGIYFLVSGVAGVGWCLASFISSIPLLSMPATFEGGLFRSLYPLLVSPILNLVAAYALLWKTDWCVKRIESISHQK